VFLLQQTTPAKLSTYAYVNPVVAVFLGWLILSEPITPMTLVSSAIILSGVAIITFFNTRAGAKPKRAAAAPQEPELAAPVVPAEPKAAHQ
jgi:drug/metabolite transporter (DMT)-like permease